MRILRKPEAAALVGLHPQSLWRLSRDGKFPKPVRLGAQSCGYVEAEVLAWIEARIAERDAETGKAA